jgi:hypothetical protein
MIPKGAFFATICIALLTWSGASIADEYLPDQFLGLDLAKAVLSPKPLGPATEFAPVAVEAKTDRAAEAAQARVEPKAEPTIVIPKTRLAHVGNNKPHGAAQTRLARRHGSPLDAQAFDARIQVWPCKSGGICNWKRSAK